jgi:hypothetical protein
MTGTDSWQEKRSREIVAAGSSFSDFLPHGASGEH